jgi:glycosyltransferase involved in cell wall biosynthesis
VCLYDEQCKHVNGKIQENEKMKVSVIVPTLNEGKYIGNLLASLKRQSHKNFEVIIIDGGSSDETISLARRYNSKVLVKHGLKEFPSRNEGAKIACGEILLFTGADVIFCENALEMVVNEFEGNKLDGMCGFGKMYDAALWGKMEYYLYYSIVNSLVRFTGVHGSTNFMALRKDEFEKVGGFESRIDGDGFLMKRFAKNRRTKFVNGKNFFLISGRRMKRMGFLGYNFHFLYVIDAIFPFLLNTRIIKYFERTSVSYRHSESQNKNPS